MLRPAAWLTAAVAVALSVPGTPSSAIVAGAEGVASGPPWISIEYPVNPYDATTREAFMLVHAFHHGMPMQFPVSGTAEGIVRGERKSLPLRIERTSRTGVYAVHKQWPNEGVWTLVVAVAQGENDRASAVVDLAPSGEVARVQVPTRRQGVHTVPATVVMSEIDRGLRARAAQLASGG